ncbi:MAG: VOC family protein [Gemmatimonadota bacterium]
MVEDQEKALPFYTEKLGFRKKTDIPMGEYRWLTAVAPDGPESIELVLEPAAFPPTKVFHKPCSKPKSPRPLSSPMTYIPSMRCSRRKGSSFAANQKR